MSEQTMTTTNKAAVLDDKSKKKFRNWYVNNREDFNAGSEI